MFLWQKDEEEMRRRIKMFVMDKQIIFWGLSSTNNDLLRSLIETSNTKGQK